MLKYIIVLLKDQSASICHYKVSNRGNDLLSIEDLNRAITFGLKQNLLFQFVLPVEPLPDEYYKIMDKVDNVQYISQPETVYDIEGCVKISVKNAPTSKEVLLVPISLISPIKDIELKLFNLIRRGFQVSVMLRDIENATTLDIEKYSQFLNRMVEFLTKHPFSQEESPLNILTDRLYLKAMNNCNAGVTSITFAPDGNFYLCPAFYYDGKEPLMTNSEGVIMLNKHLLELDYAPICLNCDAFQCHRCIYLNQKGTREINTPTHNQCIISHLERNASRLLGTNLTWINENECLPEISYLDPFELTIKK